MSKVAGKPTLLRPVGHDKIIERLDRVGGDSAKQQVDDSAPEIEPARFRFRIPEGVEVQDLDGPELGTVEQHGVHHTEHGGAGSEAEGENRDEHE